MKAGRRVALAPDSIIVDGALACLLFSYPLQLRLNINVTLQSARLGTLPRLY